MHHRRAHIHAAATFGERAADRAAAVIGSWAFLGGQSAVLACWIALNTAGVTRHWDGYPYILLNLALSFQAAFTGPILLIAANRSAQRDRLRDDIEAREVSELYAINQQQIEILHGQDAILAELRGKGNTP